MVHDGWVCYTTTLNMALTSLTWSLLTIRVYAFWSMSSSSTQQNCRARFPKRQDKRFMSWCLACKPSLNLLSSKAWDALLMFHRGLRALEPKHMILWACVIPREHAIALPVKSRQRHFLTCFVLLPNTTISPSSRNPKDMFHVSRLFATHICTVKTGASNLLMHLPSSKAEYVAGFETQRNNGCTYGFSSSCRKLLKQMSWCKLPNGKKRPENRNMIHDMVCCAGVSNLNELPYRPSMWYCSQQTKRLRSHQKTYHHVHHLLPFSL